MKKRDIAHFESEIQRLNGCIGSLLSTGFYRDIRIMALARNLGWIWNGKPDEAGKWVKIDASDM